VTIGAVAHRVRTSAAVARQLAKRGLLGKFVRRDSPPAIDYGNCRRAVLTWVQRAFAATRCGGASSGFHIVDGWGLPYPEITGYLIPTLLHAVERPDVWQRNEITALAYQAGDWLAETRLPSGAICRKQWYPGNTTPSVFNTAQVIDGWCALARHSHDARWLELASKSADWMLSEQEANGSWVRSAFNGIGSSYYARAAAPLAGLALLTGEERYARAARRHFEWVLAQQASDGWFDRTAFGYPETSVTHTIAYILEGLLDGAASLGEGRYVAAAERAARVLRSLYERRGRLPGAFGAHWAPRARWRCITGEAQLAMVWCRLSKITGDVSYRNAAVGLALDIRRTIELRADWPDVSGALPGSFPRWGDYDPYRYPTHAAKFMLDMLSALEEGGDWCVHEPEPSANTSVATR
jgi:hypothetical protein